jgi:hypothetical protein
MAKKSINSQQPPIAWDIVDQAFRDVNDNFAELYATVNLLVPGGVVDLTNLSSDITPSASGVHDLGSATKRWKDLYLTGNSLYLGDALVTATGSSVNLPAGSTIGGQLIRNPAETSFKTVRISGQGDVIADDFAGVLTLSGSGIDITTVPGSDTVTFANTGVNSIVSGNVGISVSGTTTRTITNEGVLSLTGTTGQIGVSTSTGAITLTNLGVTKINAGPGITLVGGVSTGEVTITNGSPNILQNLWRFIAVTGQTTLDPLNANSTLTITNGSGINVTTSALNNSVTITSTGVTTLAGTIGQIGVSSATGSVVLTNLGVTSLTAGDGVSVSASTGGITVTNTRLGFTSIAVSSQSPQSPILADTVTDTLTLVAGDGIILTTNATNDSITITAPLSEDITCRSISGFDSTLIINGTTSKVVGAIDTASLRTSEASVTLGYEARSASSSNYSVGIGWQAAKTGQQGYAIAIGQQAGEATQGQASIAIGPQSGQTTQGNDSIAIGSSAGQTSQGQASIAIGTQSGKTTQGLDAIAIGNLAGQTSQGLRGIAIGYQAGWVNQQERGIAIGSGAGVSNQGAYAIAIGQDTSNINSGANSIAIGQNAGGSGQGEKSIAIGHLAGVGTSATFANSIILNASGSPVSSSAAGLFIAPVRSTATNFVVHYNPVTKEVTYGEGLTVGSINVNSNVITTIDTNADLELAASGTGKVSVLDTFSVSGQTTLSNGLFQGVFDVAGLASGNVTLAATDFTGNILTAQPLFTNRELYIPDAGVSVAGMRFLFRNRSGTYSVTIKDVSNNVIDIVAASGKTELACDGYAWFVV